MRGRIEKTVVIVLAAMLFAGSMLLFGHNTRPFKKIVIVENGIKQELTLSQVEDLLKQQNKVDINKATAEELQRIPGIGAVMSLRILEYRERNGNFTRNEELLEVEGIGEKKLAAIKEHIKE